MLLSTWQSHKEIPIGTWMVCEQREVGLRREQERSFENSSIITKENRRGQQCWEGDERQVCHDMETKNSSHKAQGVLTELATWM